MMLVLIKEIMRHQKLGINVINIMVCPHFKRIVFNTLFYLELNYRDKRLATNCSITLKISEAILPIFRILVGMERV